MHTAEKTGLSKTWAKKPPPSCELLAKRALNAPWRSDVSITLCFSVFIEGIISMSRTFPTFSSMWKYDLLKAYISNLAASAIVPDF